MLNCLKKTTKFIKIGVFFALICETLLLNAIPGIESVQEIEGSPFESRREPEGLAYSPLIGDHRDQLFAAVAEYAGDKIRVYTIDSTGAFIPFQNVKTGRIQSNKIAYSPLIKNNLFAALSNGGDNSISVYKVTTKGEETGSFNEVNNSPFHDKVSAPHSLAFSPEINENLFLTIANWGVGAESVSVYKVNQDTGELKNIQFLEFIFTPLAVAYSPMINNRVFAAVTTGEDLIYIYLVNNQTGELQEYGSAIGTGGNPLGVAFSPDIEGSLFVTVANSGTQDASVYQVNLASTTPALTQIQTVTTENNPGSIAYSSLIKEVTPKRLFSAVANFGANTTSFYQVELDPLSGDFGQFTEITNSPIQSGTGPSDVAFAPLFKEQLFSAVPNFFSDNISVYQVTLPPLALPPSRPTDAQFTKQLRPNLKTLTVQYVNRVTWKPPVTGADSIVKYQVYQDKNLKKLLGQVLSTEPLEFTQKTCQLMTSYYIVAINENDLASKPAKAHLKKICYN